MGVLIRRVRGGRGGTRIVNDNMEKGEPQMDRAAVTDALIGVRNLVQADGGDMELVDVEPGAGIVSLRLVLDGVECHECVMPRSLLEDVAGNVLRKAVPDLDRVTIDDPREHPGYVPPSGH
jgi:Fe-S cluster biogenesis protein NfuA